MKFIATADWQLGMTAHFLPEEARVRFNRDRFAAVARIGDIARDHGAGFVVVAGDVFESNQLHRSVLSRAFEAIRNIDVPVVLVPGNHDPLDASSIYDSPDFNAAAPSNVRVVRSSEPLEVVPKVEVVGAPWHSKRPNRDLLAAATEQLEQTAGRLRVVVGHGATASLSPNPDDPAVIDNNALASTVKEERAQFVVLGDRHSTTEVAPGVWYPGTIEVTAKREVNPGNVLVVEIQDDGSVSVEPVRTGQWKFLDWARELTNGADIDSLVGDLEAVDNKDQTAVWLGLAGTVSVADKARLDDELARLREVFALVVERERTSELAVYSDLSDFDSLGLAGFVMDAVGELSHMTGPDDDRADAAADALSLLYRLAGGAK